MTENEYHQLPDEEKNVDDTDQAFFAPIIMAREKNSLHQERTWWQWAGSQLAQVGLAAAGALIYAEPALRFVQNDNFASKVYVVVSTLGSAFLTGKFQIGIVFNESGDDNSQANKIILPAAWTFGILSSVTFGIVQFAESEKEGLPYRLFSTALVIAGSIPAQTLGLFFFLDTQTKYASYLWNKYVRSAPDAIQYVKEHEVSEAFVAKLQAGFHQTIMNNSIPPNYLSSDFRADEFLLEILKNAPDVENRSQLYNVGKTIFGISGVFMTSSFLLPLTKITNDSMRKYMSPVMAAVMTAIVCFPNVPLAGIFGYASLTEIFQGVTELLEKFYDCLRHGKKIQLAPPAGIKPELAVVSILTVALLASRSYASLCQFMTDGFEKDVSEELLKAFEGGVTAASICTTFYMLNILFRENIITGLLKRSKNENERTQVEFYEFGENVVNAYRKMNKSLLFSGANKMADMIDDARQLPKPAGP